MAGKYIFVDADGNVIEERRGGKGSVRSSIYAYTMAQVMTHNHPRTGREALSLGDTFSTQDLDGFTRFKIRTSRATAAEGTYSITKGAKFNATAFKSYYQTELAKNRQTYVSHCQQARKTYNERGTTMENYKKYVAETTDAFNRYLVANHNTLLAGQKKYGYKYTLERRK